MSSPTQLSLAKLRKDGWFCAVTEKWNAHVKIRQDLFGFVDVLCVKRDYVLAIQTTSYPNVSARIAKLTTLPAVRLWLSSPFRLIQVHGWRQPDGRLWHCRTVDVTLSDLGELNVEDLVKQTRRKTRRGKPIEQMELGEAVAL